MLCHECLMNGKAKPAVALCKFCFVGLCKEHLMELYREPATVPQYSCRHDPARRPNWPLDAEVESTERLLREEFSIDGAGGEVGETRR